MARESSREWERHVEAEIADAKERAAQRMAALPATDKGLPPGTRSLRNKVSAVLQAALQ